MTRHLLLALLASVVLAGCATQSTPLIAGSPDTITVVSASEAGMR